MASAMIFAMTSALLMALTVASSPLSVSLSINEEAPADTIVGLLSNHKSMQQLTNNQQRLTFSLAKASPYFSIDENSGLVKSRVRIDREALCNEIDSCCQPTTAGQPECTIPLQVLVNPLKEFMQVSVTVVDVNDHAPSFAQSPMTTFVPENELPGRFCIDIPPAYDPDSAPLAVKDYRLDPFSTTFKLRMNARPATRYSDLCLLVMESLDREKVQTYSLRILAIDGGAPAKTGTLSLTVRVQDTNDNRPIFVNSSYAVSVAEHTAVNTEITRVHATDADEGEYGTVVYSFMSSVGENAATYQPVSTDRVGPFSINSETGQIILEEALDYEETRVYELRVMARDSSQRSARFSTQSVVVHVTNVNDCAPEVEILPIRLRKSESDSSTQLQVYENEAPGTTIGMVTVTDRDDRVQQAPRCALSSSHFSLVPLNGEPNKFKIVTRLSFDREDLSRFEVILRCEDSGIPPLVNDVGFTVTVLDRDDNVPHFASNETSIHVTENNAIGQLLGSLNVLDGDDELSNVLFEISSLDEIVSDIPLVTLKDETGEIFANTVFDREVKDTYRFAIRMFTASQNETIGTNVLSLIVDDANDEPPRFEQSEYNFKVHENSEARMLIGSVRARDQDSESNIRYSLVQPHSSFSVSESGELYVMCGLDRETTAAYSFQVLAQDARAPEMSAVTQVRVEVLDRNDNKPVFSWPSGADHTVNVSIYTQPGVIAQLAAYDADAGDNAVIKYTVQKRADTESLFDVDERSGRLLLKQMLQNTDRRLYKLVIEATDGGQPAQREMIVLNVVFVDSPLPQVEATVTGATGDESSRLVVVACAALLTTTLALLVIVLVVIFLRRSRAQHKATAKKVDPRLARSTSSDYEAALSEDTASESVRSSLSVRPYSNGWDADSYDQDSVDCHKQLTIHDLRPQPSATRNLKIFTERSQAQSFRNSNESLASKRSQSDECLTHVQCDRMANKAACVARAHVTDFMPITSCRPDSSFDARSLNDECTNVSTISDQSTCGLMNSTYCTESGSYRVRENPMFCDGTSPSSNYRMFTKYARAHDVNIV